VQITLAMYTNIRTRHQGRNGGICEVVLADPQQATAAVIELDNASLFDRRIELDILSATWEQHRAFGLERGWYASGNTSIWHARLREPLWSYPKDLFAPVREYRRVIVENVPYPRLDNSVSVTWKCLYELLYGFDVLSCSTVQVYKPKHSKINGCSVKFDFVTREDAEVAVDSFEGCFIGACGLPSIWSVAKVPLKYGPSWDNDTSLHRRMGHSKSGRDEGSAVGTNWEFVSVFLALLWHVTRV
jgi:hypothetical protein